MKFSALLAHIPLVAAIPGSKQDKGSEAPFSVTSAHSGSPIHLLPLNAAGSYLWLRGNAQSYSPVEGIPKTNQTDVIVPGGQAVYVDSKGALRFTTPHSASEPAGSSNGPFTYTPSSSFGHWTYTGQGASGFMACPTVQASVNTRRARRAAAAPQYQVFAALKNATVPTGNLDDCTCFDAFAVSANGATLTWEYI